MRERDRVCSKPVTPNWTAIPVRALCSGKSHDLIGRTPWSRFLCARQRNTDTRSAPRRAAEVTEAPRGDPLF